MGEITVCVTTFGRNDRNSAEALPDADDECMSEISVEMDWSEEEEEEDVSRDLDWAELEEIVSESDNDSEDTTMRDDQQTKNVIL